MNMSLIGTIFIATILIIGTVVIFYLIKDHLPFLKISQSKETFALDVEQPYRRTIVQTFNTLLGRDPQEFEIQLYRNYMTAPNDTTYLYENIKNSKEYTCFIKNTLIPAEKIEQFDQDMDINADAAHTYSMSLDLDTRLAIYKSIIKIFEINLMRLPTLKELEYFTYKLSSTKQLTLEQIESLVISSPEYKNLQNLQTNQVHSDVVENITDAQLTMIVKDVYAQVWVCSEPAPELQAFLKVKLYEYGMNTEKLRQLILLMDKLDNTVIPLPDPSSNNQSVQPVSNNQSVQPVSNNQSFQAGAGYAMKNDLAVPSQRSQTSQTSQRSQANHHTISDQAQHAVSKEHISFNQPYNPDQCLAKCENQFKKAETCIEKQYKKGDSNLDALYENMKWFQEQPENECIYDWNKTSEHNSFANAQKERNNDIFNARCMVEDQMEANKGPYDPLIDISKMNTKFGAPLEDAYDTKVGSIMPRFVYKEYV